MDRDKLKDRIEKRFIKKPGKSLVINLEDGKKLKVRYMFGFRYSIHRKMNKKISTLSIICKLDEVVDIIIDEKKHSEGKDQILDEIKRGRRR